ncbi:MAG: hypothetical protein ABMA64_22495, partial [Myxococcota bacterium]
MSEVANPVVVQQVQGLLAKSPGFRGLGADEQRQVMRDTIALADAMVADRLKQQVDPFAVPMAGPPGPPTLPGGMPGGGMPGTPKSPGAGFTGGATQKGPQDVKQGEFGAAVKTGVNQAGEMLRQINFPAFVAELVQGVFQAVVDASIQQMKAYGELVQSVTMSLNQFRDANVSTNQARDHLVGRYPGLMQVNIVNGTPRVGLRPGADDSDLPNFAEELGMSERITSLDEETIEDKLVPAARNDLARSRQSLLATMVLMGINRIVVTDGRINAKLNFDFRASDSQRTQAQTYDYENFGTTRTEQGRHESSEETGPEYRESNHRSAWGGRGRSRSGESSRWTSGEYQVTETPAVYLTNVTDTNTVAELEAKAKLTGEVSLNFKTETFNLNQLASADEVFKLERVRSAGRGAPGAA